MRRFSAIVTGLALIGGSLVLGRGVASADGTPPTCTITVPADPLTAKGLSTPYVLKGCQEANADTSAFVQAAILTSGGAVAVYAPLVITRGTEPATPPVVPVVPKGSTVAIWFGFNGTTLKLTGPGAESCVNGLRGSLFGQFAACNAEQWFNKANSAVAAGTLVIPPLGVTNTGAVCPTVSSFQVADQDASDNVQSMYLTSASGIMAQDTAANRALFPSDTVVLNPSDNLVLTNFIDPALGCSPWLAPNAADPGATVPALALDQLQARALQASPVADVPLVDEMTLVHNRISLEKTLLYRVLTDESPSVSVTEAYYCQNLTAVFPPFLALNQASLTAAGAPGGGTLYDFLKGRFQATYAMVLPAPGIVPTCQTITGVPDPTL
jgi:hypothetical protein